MSLLRLIDTERYFGAERVFGPINAEVQPSDKVGFIGRNGAGKTTLLRVIAGLDPPDSGQRVLARNATLGFMRQDVELDEPGTLWSYVAIAKEDVARLGHRLEQLEMAMADPAIHSSEDALTEVLAEYASVRGRFEHVGGYSSDAAIRATLFGLGFTEPDLSLAFGALSGGQKARAALARLLLTSPDLLLLDEPTNHLDMAAVEWLEEYLHDYKGAIIVVSHDRAFLDGVVNHIWELEDADLWTYNGNYTASRAVREQRRERAQKEYMAQQQEIADLEAYVRRYKAGNRATMAKSREKALERITRINRPTADDDNMRMHLLAGPRSGKEVVFLDGVGKSYDDRTILQNVELLACRGDRIGIVGPNGSGKSTLLKIIAGIQTPSAGKVRYGKDVVIGYFSQELADLNPAHTVIDEVLSARHMTLYEARSHLARFMFRGEDVFKQVGVLSGGERNRLTLAKLVLTEANLLLLDEPTNHLDIPGREALEESLQTYGGTLLFVSHDRYFLESLAKRIWLVQDGRVVDNSGTYGEFKLRQGVASKASAQAAEPVCAGKSDYHARREAELQRRAEERAARKAAAQLRELEQAIADTEAEKSNIELSMTDTSLFTDAERARAATQAHKEVLARLEELYRRWEELAEAQS